MPRLLDLFCCAGGAAMGYHRAGFDVVGVDIKPQPHYPFEFHRADAMTFPIEGFDAVHASPPCQDHSALKATMPESHGTGWMLAATVARLQASGLPWVVENVEGATMPADTYSIVLCGSSFGLKVRRHRRFATNVFVMTPPCDPRAQGLAADVTGHGTQGREYRRRKALGLPLDTQADREAAMGIDWMNRDELAQAIPPAYTELIGAQLLSARWARVSERPEDAVNGDTLDFNFDEATAAVQTKQAEWFKALSAGVGVAEAEFEWSVAERVKQDALVAKSSADELRDRWAYEMGWTS
mgnify:FL=1